MSHVIQGYYSDDLKRYMTLGPEMWFSRSRSKAYRFIYHNLNIALPTVSGATQEPGLSRIWVENDSMCYGFFGQFSAKLTSAGSTAVANFNFALFHANGAPDFDPMYQGIVNANAQGTTTIVASADDSWTTQYGFHAASLAPFYVPGRRHYFIATMFGVTVENLTAGGIYGVGLDCVEAVNRKSGFRRDISLAAAAFSAGDMSALVPSGWPTGFTNRASDNHLANMDWGLILREIS